MNGQPMKRHEWWRMQYRKRRYMEYLDDAGLAVRFHDVMKNSLTLTEKGQIGLLSEPITWLELFTHVLEEYGLRGGIPPGVMKDFGPPTPTFPGAPRGMPAFERVATLKTPYLVKYGQAPHIKAMFERGLIRVSPASSYDDPSLDPARRDNELAVVYEVHPREAELRVQKPDGTPGEKIDLIGNLRLDYSFPKGYDYYVFCMSSGVDLRLFGDFTSDACLLMLDPEQFSERMIKAFEKATKGWTGIGLPVTYVDPLNPPRGKPDPAFVKHFRYWYQKEHRLVWIPKIGTPLTKLAPITLEVGPLHDIAELLLV
jgi:hypothetical protein